VAVKVFILIFILTYSLFGPLMAMELGKIEVLSHINEPLNARISLSSEEYQDLEDIRVIIASHMEFKKLGLDKKRFSQPIRFKLIRQSDEEGYIQLLSKTRIKEPLLEFAIKLISPQTTLVKRISLLLYPQDHIVPNQIDNIPIPDQSIDKPDAKNKLTAFSSYGPVAVGDSLSSIANKLRTGNHFTLKELMQKIFESNPSAFINQDKNRLKAGVLLKIPAIISQPISKPPQSVPIETESNIAAEQRQWVVNKGDSLSLIAGKLAQDSVLNSQKIMQLLYENNPTAFINNNINLLKEGSTLILPENGTINNLNIGSSQNSGTPRNKDLPKSSKQRKALNTEQPQLRLLGKNSPVEALEEIPTKAAIHNAEQELLLLAMEKIKRLKQENQSLKKRYTQLLAKIEKTTEKNRLLDQEITLLKATGPAVVQQAPQASPESEPQGISSVTKVSNIVKNAEQHWLDASISIGELIVFLLSLLIILLCSPFYFRYRYVQRLKKRKSNSPQASTLAANKKSGGNSFLKNFVRSNG